MRTAALVLLVAATPAAGQACLGGNVESGQWAIGATAAHHLQAGTQAYGGELVAYSAPLYIAARGAGGGVRGDRAYLSETMIGYAPPNPTLQLCAAAGMLLSSEGGGAGGRFAVGAGRMLDVGAGLYARLDGVRHWSGDASGWGFVATMGSIFDLSPLQAGLALFADPAALSRSVGLSGLLRVLVP